jgi:hypothetical protein
MNKISTLMLLIGFLFFSIGLRAQIVMGTVSVGSGSNLCTLTVITNTNTNTVSFQMKGPSTKWFGFGFATSSMGTGAYTILGNVNGQNPSEYNQVNHATPTLQSVQNLSGITSSTAGGFTTYQFSRALNTGNSNDYTFSGQVSTINLIWAYGNTTSLANHANRGVTSIALVNACNIPITQLSAISICQGDSALIFGNYELTAGTYFDTLSTTLGCDSVLSRVLNVQNGIANQLPVISLCQGDSVEVFGNWVSQPGLYTDSLNSVQGCDSIVSVQVDEVILNTQVSQQGNQLQALGQADSYQWIDCDTELPISGATQSLFAATYNGSFKVTLSQGNCSQESSCFTVQGIGMDEKNIAPIQWGPNPVQEQLWLSAIPAGSSIMIKSIDGRLLLSQNLEEGNNKIDINELTTGLYLVQIQFNNQNVMNFKVLKK